MNVVTTLQDAMQTIPRPCTARKRMSPPLSSPFWPRLRWSRASSLTKRETANIPAKCLRHRKLESQCIVVRCRRVLCIDIFSNRTVRHLPHIAPQKCTATQPTGSSILRRSKSDIARRANSAPTHPTTIASQGS